jgi:hypothetical protein
MFTSKHTKNFLPILSLFRFLLISRLVQWSSFFCCRFAIQKAPAYSIYLPYFGKKLLKIFGYFREQILLAAANAFSCSVFVSQTTAVPRSTRKFSVNSYNCLWRNLSEVKGQSSISFSYSFHFCFGQNLQPTIFFKYWVPTRNNYFNIKTLEFYLHSLFMSLYCFVVIALFPLFL